MSSNKENQRYTRNDLEEAVRTVKGGRLSLRKASAQYRVPRGTIDDHVKERYAMKHKGPARGVTDDEEEALEGYILYMGQHGFPPKRSDIRTLIRELIARSGRSTKFNIEEGPSDFWFRSFLERHQTLTEKVPQLRELARSRMSSEFVIDGFLTLFEKTVGDIDVRPSQIFNCDETGVTSKQKCRERSLGGRGMICNQDQVITVDHVTVHMCISAGGSVLPSMIIYQRSLPYMDGRSHCPDDWHFAASESGYMNRELFTNWFLNVFVPNCGQRRPVLLLLDNHDSHYSIDVLDKAIASDIHILTFPAHTTHILQPLDVKFFGGLKRKFFDLAVAWSAVSHSTVTRSNFSQIWKAAVDSYCSPAVVKKAFEKSGLVPFNRMAIDRSQLTHTSSSSTTNNTTNNTDNNNNNNNNNNKEDDYLVCPTCGQLEKPHPIVAVRKLPAELRSVFQEAEAISRQEEDKPKKRRVTIDKGRLITGEYWYNQIKKKHDDQLKEKQEKEKRKEERERKRLEKQIDQESKQKSQKKRPSATRKGFQLQSILPVASNCVDTSDVARS